MKTWFITGVSRGLGLALAQAALDRGDTVVGTVRSGSPALTPGKGALHILNLEITDPAAVEATVAKAFDLAGGRLDVVVNNAGHGLLGAIEDVTDQEAQGLFAVDVFGPLRVIRAALPRLRAQGSGHILNVTSIAGRAPMAGSGLYAAAKFALEGLSAVLAQEVEAFGIKVTAIAPGAFRTDFLSDHSIRYSAAPGEGYAGSVGQSLARLGDMAGRQIGDPARAADAILQLVDSQDPPAHLLLGSDALRRAREKLDVLIADLDRWEAVTRSTDYPAEG